MAVGISEAPVHMRFCLERDNSNMNIYQSLGAKVRISHSYIFCIFVLSSNSPHYSHLQKKRFKEDALRRQQPQQPQQPRHPRHPQQPQQPRQPQPTPTLRRRGFERRMPALRPQLLPSPVFCPMYVGCSWSIVFRNLHNFAVDELKAFKIGICPSTVADCVQFKFEMWFGAFLKNSNLSRFLPWMKLELGTMKKRWYSEASFSARCLTT